MSTRLNKLSSPKAHVLWKTFLSHRLPCSSILNGLCSRRGIFGDILFVSIQQRPSPAPWGWEENGNGWTPKWTHLPEAAKDCYGLIHCWCKQTCKGLCKCYFHIHFNLLKHSLTGTTRYLVTNWATCRLKRWYIVHFTMWLVEAFYWHSANLPLRWYARWSHYEWIIHECIYMCMYVYIFMNNRLIMRP